jgi:hypothetical protein
MKMRLLSFLLLLVCSLVAAQSVHLTVPALDSSGAAVPIGTAYFSWGQFKDNAGVIVQSGQVTRTFSNGTLDVTLTASDSAGYVYTVLLMRGSTPNTFKWRVPAAGATTMAQLNQPASPESGDAITALTGDVSASGPGSAVAALASVNGAPGACGDATHSCAITTDGKGRVTAQAAAAITATVAPAAPNTAVQYNASGVTGGDARLTWDSSLGQLGVAANTTSASLTFPSSGAGTPWWIQFPNNEAGKADFGITTSYQAAANGAPRRDNILGFGFNRGPTGKQVSTDHAFFFDIENAFTTPSLIPQVEFYFDYQNAANTVDYRPFSITPHLNNDTIDVATRADNAIFGYNDASNDWLSLGSTATSGQMFFSRSSTVFVNSTAADWLLMNGNPVISKSVNAGQVDLAGGYTEANLCKYFSGSADDCALTFDGNATKHGIRWNHTTHIFEFQNDARSWFAFGSVLTLQATSAPTCAAGVRGQFQYTAGGGGVKDIVQVCAKDASDVYAWRPIY